MTFSGYIGLPGMGFDPPVPAHVLVPPNSEMVWGEKADHPFVEYVNMDVETMRAAVPAVTGGNVVGWVQNILTHLANTAEAAEPVVTEALESLIQQAVATEVTRQLDQRAVQPTPVQQAS